MFKRPLKGPQEEMDADRTFPLAHMYDLFTFHLKVKDGEEPDGVPQSAADFFFLRHFRSYNSKNWFYGCQGLTNNQVSSGMETLVRPS